MGGYNFEVVIKDGVGQVLHITPGMEDGLWSVGGTDDQWGASINVTHRRPSGQYVAEAQHASNPANYKTPDVPGLAQMKGVYISMGFSPADAEKYAMQALSNVPGGTPMPVPAPPVSMPPGLINPAEAQEAAQHGEIPKDAPPGAKPFDYNDKSTWPEALRKSNGIGPDSDPEGSPAPPLDRRGPYTSEDDATGRPFRDEPRMRGDIQL